MNDLIDAMRAASTETVATAEEAAAAAKKAIPDARRALRDAKAEADSAHRANSSAESRLQARQTALQQLAERVDDAAFSGSTETSELVGQYLQEKTYCERLSRATARHGAYQVRTASRNVLEQEIAVAKTELQLAESEHDALLYKLLLATKQLAMLNGSQIEISETQFANGRVAELRGEIGRLDRDIQGLQRKLASHDEVTTRLREGIK